MRSKCLFLFCAIIISCQFLIVNYSFAQTDVKLSPEVGARLSVGLDKKIVKGLHVSIEEEARFDNNFKSFDRLQTTLALKYKVHENVKLGLGYMFITPYKSSEKAFNNFRHRLYFDITGTLKIRKWNLSLKERFQWTYRSGDVNLYQNPRNCLILKKVDTFGSNTESENEEEDKDNQGVQPGPRRVRMERGRDRQVCF